MFVGLYFRGVSIFVVILLTIQDTLSSTYTMLVLTLNSLAYRNLSCH